VAYPAGTKPEWQNDDRVKALIASIEEKGTFLPIMIDCQGLRKEAPFGGLIELLCQKLKLSQEVQLKYEQSSLLEFFDPDNRECFFKGKDVILFLDDIDQLGAMPDRERLNLLGQLRALKQKSLNYCLQSALSITNVVIESLVDTLGNSPFNSATALYAPFFGKEEHEDLFRQYEVQEGITIEQSILDNIYDQTRGAPGLEQLYGAFLHTMRSQSVDQAPPDLSTWLNATTGQSFYIYVLSTANFQQVESFLEQAKVQRNNPVLQELFDHAQNLKLLSSSTRRELLRRNVLRRTAPDQLGFASPFMRQFVMNILWQRPPLSVIPLHIEGSAGTTIDALKLICEIVQRMCPAQLGGANKKASNLTCSLLPPGPTENAYRQEFYSVFSQLVDRYPGVVRMETEITVSADAFNDYRFPHNVAEPRRSLRCDQRIVSQSYGDILLEHAANVSISPTNFSSASLWHHVYAQAELYEHALKPRSAWVIHWTTVPNDKVLYVFWPSERVQTIWIYHSSDFRRAEVHTGPGIFQTIDIPWSFNATMKRKHRTFKEAEEMPAKSEEKMAKQRRADGPLRVFLVHAATEQKKLMMLSSNTSFNELLAGVQTKFATTQPVRCIQMKGADIESDTDVAALQNSDELVVCFAE